LSRLQSRLCTDVSTSSCLCSLASEFCSRRRAFADAVAQLVACVIGCASSAFGGAIAESCPTADDFMLVHQQLLRSRNRRRLDALLGRRTYSLHNASQRGPLLSLRSFHRSVSVLVFRRRLRGVEPFGARRILGVDPNTVIFQCRLSVNHCPVDCDMGHEWSSAHENSITFALPGGMRRLSRFAGNQLCCPLRVRIFSGSGSAFSPSTMSALGGGTLRRFGNKHCHFDCRLPGDLERIPRTWTIFG